MSSDADRILQLGRDLANALDHSDVIGRWMSHHLAELITQCESNPKDKELAAATRDVVLQLWERKRGAQFKIELFAYVEPVLRAIARLDREPDPWAFYRPFGEQVPGAEELSTYPLLRLACDIDREVGQLIRFGVAMTAREALSREKPWVMAGLETVESEEDSAIRALQQYVRRVKLASGDNPSKQHESDNRVSEESGSTHSVEPSVGEEHTIERGTADAPVDVAAETFESADALTVALRSAVVRCRRVIDQFAELSEVQTAVPDELHSRRTEAVAYEGQTPETVAEPNLSPKNRKDAL